VNKENCALKLVDENNSLFAICQRTAIVSSWKRSAQEPEWFADTFLRDVKNVRWVQPPIHGCDAVAPKASITGPYKPVCPWFTARSFRNTVTP